MVTIQNVSTEHFGGCICLKVGSLEVAPGLMGQVLKFQILNIHNLISILYSKKMF